MAQSVQQPGLGLGLHGSGNVDEAGHGSAPATIGAQRGAQSADIGSVYRCDGAGQQQHESGWSADVTELERTDVRDTGDRRHLYTDVDNARTRVDVHVDGVSDQHARWSYEGDRQDSRCETREVDADTLQSSVMQHHYSLRSMHMNGHCGDLPRQGVRSGSSHAQISSTGGFGGGDRRFHGGIQRVGHISAEDERSYRGPGREDADVDVNRRHYTDEQRDAFIGGSRTYSHDVQCEGVVQPADLQQRQQFLTALTSDLQELKRDREKDREQLNEIVRSLKGLQRGNMSSDNEVQFGSSVRVNSRKSKKGADDVEESDSSTSTSTVLVQGQQPGSTSGTKHTKKARVQDSDMDEGGSPEANNRRSVTHTSRKESHEQQDHLSVSSSGHHSERTLIKRGMATSHQKGRSSSSSSESGQREDEKYDRQPVRRHKPGENSRRKHETAVKEVAQPTCRDGFRHVQSEVFVPERGWHAGDAVKTNRRGGRSPTPDDKRGSSTRRRSDRRKCDRVNNSSRKKMQSSSSSSDSDNDGDRHRSRREREDKDRQRRNLSPESEPDATSPHHDDRRRSSRHRERKHGKSNEARKKRREIKPDHYNGKSCLETFLVKFGRCAKYNGWNEEDKAAHLQASLVDGAASLLWQIEDDSYEAIIDKLRSRYGTGEQQEKFRVELLCRRRKPNESLQELAQEVERLVALAHPTAATDMKDLLAREAFVQALDNPRLEDKVREREPDTLRKALTITMKLEVIYNARQRQRDAQKPRQIRAAQTGNQNDEDEVQAQYCGQSKPKQNNNRKNKGRNEGKARQCEDTQQKAERRQLEREPEPQQQHEVEELRRQVAQLTAVVSQSSMTPCWYGQSSTAYVGQPEPARYQQSQSLQQTEAQPVTIRGGRASARAVICYNCSELGHYSRDCPYPQRGSSNTGVSGQPPTTQAPIANQGGRTFARPALCFNCSEPGHYIRDCPYPRTGSSRPGASEQQPPTTRAYGATNGRLGSAPVYLGVNIGGRHQLCLLDTGCDVTLIPARVMGKQTVHPTTQQCIAANGTQIPILGWTSINAQVGKSPVEITGLVTEHIDDIMLGIDWLNEYNAVWDFLRGEITLEGQVYELQAKESSRRWGRRVILAEDTTIPARSQQDVTTKVVFKDLHPKGFTSPGTWGTEAGRVQRGLHVARTLLPNRANNLPVRLLNTLEHPIELQKDTVISTLAPVTTVAEARVCQQEHQMDDSSTDTSIIEEMMSTVDPTLSEHIKCQLRRLLQKYSSVFSKDEWDLGWTDAVTHKIETGDSKPFRQPLRRYPPAHYEAINKNLEDMLRQDVIEPTSSPWASNVVLAKKKDGTYRCCIDYRQLNNLTRKDAYPLPRTDECLDAMSGSKWFSTFDLRSGFHQVCMDPQDSDKTAFITRRGMYKFKKMPFGLCNAVATFQRLMDLVLTGLNLEVCLSYLDDIILFSETPEQHLERLELLLQRLKEANLKLKPSKCNLMRTEVAFLGHVVSGGGIAADPEKVRLIKEWTEPRNLRQLRGFLGLTGYYRRFVKDYAKIAGPLNDLTKKNCRFVWTADCQEAFEKLKASLSSPPILSLPNDHDVFILDTDAAENSIGAVLSQRQGDLEKVIAYGGRRLSQNERNYCVTRKELLAIVHFVKHFKQYLLGQCFEVRTDHAALSWLTRTPQPIGQNARWLQQLGEYKFDITHRPGARHGNADALSRHPCLNKPSCTACHPELMTCSEVRATVVDHVNEDGPADQSTELKQVASPDDEQQLLSGGDTQPETGQGPLLNEDGPADCIGWSKEEMAAAQRQDSEVGVIIALMDSNKEKPPWKEVELQSSPVKSLWHEWERLEIRDGILCRKWTLLHDTVPKWQIVLPRIYRKDFIRMSHTGMTGGHLGRSKTEEQVRARAYWPSWRPQVAAEIKRCEECVKYHRGKAPRQTPLQPFGAGEPFEIVAVDITGKHPRSARGNEYIVTVTDIFSKWAEAYPVRTHTAPVVAKMLVDNFFSRFGMPKRLLTDQGREFESQLFQELCVRMGIEKIRTTSYQPSTNGCVERFHRTLNSMLAKVIRQNQRDWDDHLQPVMAAYRAAKHESTGFSPNLLVLGRENRAPLDVVLGEITGEEQYYNSHDDYVQQLQERMRNAHALAREHLEAAAERRKNNYDIRVKEKQFEVGQWVWYFYPRRYLKRSPKWTKNYDGPFLIVKRIPPSDYVIQRSRRSQVQVVHGDKLKLCFGETPTSWLRQDEHKEDDENSDQGSHSQQDVAKTIRKRRERVQRDDDAVSTSEILEWERTRPRRERKLPSHFQEYHM